MCKEILILYCLLFHTEIYMFYLLKCDNVSLSIILYFLFALKNANLVLNTSLNKKANLSV